MKTVVEIYDDEKALGKFSGVCCSVVKLEKENEIWIVIKDSPAETRSDNAISIQMDIKSALALCSELESAISIVGPNYRKEN